MKCAKKVIQIYSLIPDFKEDPTVMNMLRFSEVHLSVANTFLCAQTAWIALFWHETRINTKLFFYDFSNIHL